MKILITGAFGFVGTSLSAYLAGKGYELWALDVESPLTETRRVQSVYQKCFDWKQLEKIPWSEVDAVIHLAGKAHDTRNTSEAKSYFDINVGLTEKVVQAWKKAFARADAETKTQRKFILFSSVKAVADRVEDVLTEKAIPNPQTPYGQSKLKAEGVVRSAIGDRQSAVTSYILRSCMIHGPGNKGNLNLLYGVVKKGMPWPLGAFENQRSFMSIGNVCAVVEKLLTASVPAGVYQMADDESVSTNELIGLISEALGKKARIWRIPSKWVRASARIGDALRLPLNSERLKKLTESYIVSNARIKGAFGWTAMPVSAREGLKATLESFRQARP